MPFPFAAAPDKFISRFSSLTSISGSSIRGMDTFPLIVGFKGVPPIIRLPFVFIKEFLPIIGIGIEIYDGIEKSIAIFCVFEILLILPVAVAISVPFTVSPILSIFNVSLANFSAAFKAAGLFLIKSMSSIDR